MLNTFFIVYLLSAGIIGMLAASILIYININKEVTRFLGFHLFVVSFHAFSIVAIIDQTVLKFPHIYYFDIILLMLNAPVLYFYLRNVLTKQKFSFEKDIWHFVSAVAFFIYKIPFFVKSADEKQEVIRTVLNTSKNINIYLTTQDYYFILIAISSVIYSILNYRLYLNFKKQNEYSNAEVSNFFKWIKLFLKVGFTNILIFVSASIYVESDFASNNLIHLVLGFHIIFLSITLFTNPHILYGINEPLSLKTALEINTGKVKTVINNLQKENYLKTLEEYLINNPFLKTGFTIKKMSLETNINVHHLSFLINEHYKMNYNDFVNKHRIEYVITSAKECKWDNYTIEGIAYETGFKSKSTFIKSFRKITETTPSNYLFKCKAK